MRSPAPSLSSPDVYHCFFVDPAIDMKVTVVDGKRTFDSPDHRKIRCAVDLYGCLIQRCCAWGMSNPALGMCAAVTCSSLGCCSAHACPLFAVLPACPC